MGLLLVLAGISGLVYYACAPKATAPRAPSGAPIVARPARPERVAEEPAARPPEPKVIVTEKPPKPAEPAPEPDARPTNGVEGPAGSADVPEPRREIVEPSVKLTPDAPPAIEPPKTERRAIRMPRVTKGEFERNPGAAGEVALSFDGCYDDKPLPKILTTLDHHGYKATFFVAGRFAQRYPHSVKRIADDGMELGNHSWSHPKFTELTDAQIDSQLTRTNDLIREISGQTPTLFRPPFGDRDNRVRNEVAADGFHTVCWALDSWDSVKKGITSDEISKRVLGRVQPGDVVLLHVGSQATADALPAILEGLDARGLRVVPVSELMKG
jgi:peptidoglycan/xylan/chitin deacetylase (PgdA/CDA1 family)